MTIYSPYKAQRAQSECSFSFAAETPANENHHAFGNLRAFCPSGLEFIPFRPLSEKELKVSFANFAARMSVANGR